MGDLRYRKSRDAADRLGQVWTPPVIAELLASTVPVEHGKDVHFFDLGAGQGALTKALLQAHQGSTATMIELDSEYVRTLRSQKDKRSTVLQADVLDASWACKPTPSIIVSNPPYGSLAAPMDLRVLVENTGLGIPFEGKWIRRDAAFLARAWELASKGTGLGFIVAAPLISNPCYRELRKRLVSEMRGLCVTQLSPLTFKNAEVNAYLISGERALNRKRNVLLRKASSEGEVTTEIVVSALDAVQSLDIDYHLALKRLGVSAKSLKTLGSVGVAINRGSKTQKEFKDQGVSAFHTTDFPDNRNQVILGGKVLDSCHVAVAGDILIPRVGSRCLDKQAQVENGTGLFTDCVYRLSVKGRTRSKVWKTLNSSFGTEWRMANAAGSCAKHLPIKTLLNMPVIG